MQFVSDGNPSSSALYLVDRGSQGKWYRWYDAKTDQWGRCGADMQEALDHKDSTGVGFFPWVGPLTGPKLNTKAPVETVVEDKAPPKASKPAKKMAKQRGAKLVVSKVGNVTVGSIVKPAGKTVHPDGTVWFREDRQKWVAMWNGKQEAARPTAEACLKFLTKKYGVTGTVIPKE
jgi:hypothetical protein